MSSEKRGYLKTSVQAEFMQNLLWAISKKSHIVTGSIKLAKNTKIFIGYSNSHELQAIRELFMDIIEFKDLYNPDDSLNDRVDNHCKLVKKFINYQEESIKLRIESIKEKCNFGLDQNIREILCNDEIRISKKLYLLSYELSNELIYNYDLMNKIEKLTACISLCMLLESILTKTSYYNLFVGMTIDDIVFKKIDVSHQSINGSNVYIEIPQGEDTCYPIYKSKECRYMVIREL